MTVDPISGLRAAKMIDEAVGLLAKLVNKLRARPDIAAVKLSAALDEIVKTYRVVDEALTAYVGLGIDRDGLDSGSKQLLAIAGGSLGVRVGEGRGHCHQIRLIYQEHLLKWFEKVFNGAELAEMKRVFDMLSEGDRTVFDDLVRVVDQLQADAMGVLDLVIAQKPDEARQRVLQTYRILAPVQQAMSTGVQRIFELKDTFTGLARAT